MFLREIAIVIIDWPCFWQVSGIAPVFERSGWSHTTTMLCSLARQLSSHGAG